ncbi:hypothetical protein ASD83_09005 [Devosia sp. Root685]|uniref:type II toxin-antitoxin system RelE/ParE family toxin n=1 Tax=Devosia sp. Root685 TaxID=1736587 RepID=UPI0006FE06DA|nr:type II toxin-antitoxin system RelE/ParE family toxin [Devosia sp. Root685]KRA97276.1 hypothetical protein ASD83_09005 [Devosia sp. Root685]
MPHLTFAVSAQRDLDRLRRFLLEKNPLAAKRATQAIKMHTSALTTAPEMGRPSDTIAGVRELLVPFGDAGYIVRYGYNERRDEVFILRVWHQKETGY